MRWSWRIARLAGIGIYVHVTFPLLLIWAGLAQFAVRHRLADAAIGIAFIVALFAIVVLHELGHALTARRFGIGARDITLLPIGGVARLDRIPDVPRQELLVALAGPAVNVALALLFLGVLAAVNQLAAITNLQLIGDSFLASLVLVNIILVAFNLIPAFPMDGGRVLRALLAARMDYVRATTIAARIGQAIAFLFGCAGLASIFFGDSLPFSNPLLLLIGMFVYMGAAQESALVRMKSALGGVSVGQLMVTDFRTLAPNDPLPRAVQCLLAGWQHDFPVLENGQLVGLLTRAGLMSGLAEHGQRALVGQVMKRLFLSVPPGESAEAVFLRLRAGDRPTLLITQDHQLLGILTMQQISDYLMVQAALHPEPESPPLPPRPAERQVA